MTSYTELARDGDDAERWNRLHPEEPPRLGYLQAQLEGRTGPVVSASDYVRAHAEQIRSCLGRPYAVLGTDGWGRSDTRARLRDFFEVDRHHVVVATLKVLADQGEIAPGRVSEAIERYGLDAARPSPRVS